MNGINWKIYGMFSEKYLCLHNPVGRIPWALGDGEECMGCWYRLSCTYINAAKWGVQMAGMDSNTR